MFQNCFPFLCGQGNKNHVFTAIIINVLWRLVLLFMHLLLLYNIQYSCVVAPCEDKKMIFMHVLIKSYPKTIMLKDGINEEYKEIDNRQ